MFKRNEDVFLRLSFLWFQTTVNPLPPRTLAADTLDAKGRSGIDTRPQQSTETQSTSSQSTNKNQGKIDTLFIKLSL